MDTIKEVAEVLSGFTTPLIAAIALYIAWQQHKTSWDALKVNLYDRRLKVYRGLVDLFAVVLQDVDINPSAMNWGLAPLDPSHPTPFSLGVIP